MREREEPVSGQGRRAEEASLDELRAAVSECRPEVRTQVELLAYRLLPPFQWPEGVKIADLTGDKFKRHWPEDTTEFDEGKWIDGLVARDETNEEVWAEFAEVWRIYQAMGDEEQWSKSRREIGNYLQKLARDLLHEEDPAKVGKDSVAAKVAETGVKLAGEVEAI